MKLTGSLRNKEKRKNIFSWVALICGILSFFYTIHGTLCILYIIKYRGVSRLLMPVSIIAIFSGIFGLIGKVNKGTRIRSFVGVILGILFWVLYWIWLAYLVD